MFGYKYIFLACLYASYVDIPNLSPPPKNIIKSTVMVVFSYSSVRM